MKATKFRSWALLVVKTSVDVRRERGKSKKRVEQEMIANLVHKSVISYLESACNYINISLRWADFV